MNSNNGTHTDSSSAAGSMDDTSNTRRRRRRETLAKAHSLTTTNHRHHQASNFFNNNGGYVENENDDSEEEGFEGGDSEMWNTFNNNFQQVQSVLDRNRVLIQQVNDNHQSRGHDNLVKNVGLIQELNGNISKVRSLYGSSARRHASVVQEQ